MPACLLGYACMQGTKTMLNSLMYKMSYLDFAEESQLSFGRRGMDRVRNTVIGRLNVKLNYFEEVCALGGGGGSAQHHLTNVTLMHACLPSLM